MCGIAGYIANQVVQTRFQLAVAMMACEIESRGPQSWGATDGMNHVKHVGAVTSTMSLSMEMPKEFVLHTRWATAGKTIPENCHPFEMKGKLGTIVGVHNGIIDNHYQLDAKYQDFEVDSQHIFNLIVEGEDLNQLRGYGAIVYCLNGEWFIGRFNNGDMEVVKTPVGIFFASTKTALKKAMSMAGITIEQWLNVKDNSVYRITPEGLQKAYKLKCAHTSRAWDDDLTKDYFTYTGKGETKPATRGNLLGSYTGGANWGGRFRAGQGTQGTGISQASAAATTRYKVKEGPKEPFCETCGISPTSLMLFFCAGGWRCSICKEALQVKSKLNHVEYIYYIDKGTVNPTVAAPFEVVPKDTTYLMKCVDCQCEFDVREVEEGRDSIRCNGCDEEAYQMALRMGKPTHDDDGPSVEYPVITELEVEDFKSEFECDLCEETVEFGDAYFQVIEDGGDDEEEETLLCVTCYYQQFGGDHDDAGAEAEESETPTEQTPTDRLVEPRRTSLCKAVN